MFAKEIWNRFHEDNGGRRRRRRMVWRRETGTSKRWGGVGLSGVASDVVVLSFCIVGHASGVLRG